MRRRGGRFDGARGRKHYSGTYWAATEHGHVIYESRLELARLLFADFALDVRRIVAQPFMLRVRVDGTARRHIPDYLLLSENGPVVVDVKPRTRLDNPTVRTTFGWTRELVEALGWRYEVWSEPAAVELANVRFLAGYRRTWLFDPVLLDELRALDLDGASVREACSTLPARPEPLVRSEVFHLLWTQHFTVDLTQVLSSGTVISRRRVG